MRIVIRSPNGGITRLKSRVGLVRKRVGEEKIPQGTLNCNLCNCCNCDELDISCCPGISEILFARFAGAIGCECILGLEVELVYSPFDGLWHGSFTICNSDLTNLYLECNADGKWYLVGTGGCQFSSSVAASCPVFSFSTQNLNCCDDPGDNMVTIIIDDH